MNYVAEGASGRALVLVWQIQLLLEKPLIKSLLFLRALVLILYFERLFKCLCSSIKKTRTNSGTEQADDEDWADQDVTEGIGENKVLL